MDRELVFFLPRCQLALGVNMQIQGPGGRRRFATPHVFPSEKELGISKVSEEPTGGAVTSRLLPCVKLPWQDLLSLCSALADTASDWVPIVAAVVVIIQHWPRTPPPRGLM